jgi:hypothetical protein
MLALAELKPLSAETISAVKTPAGKYGWPLRMAWLDDKPVGRMSQVKTASVRYSDFKKWDIATGTAMTREQLWSSMGIRKCRYGVYLIRELPLQWSQPATRFYFRDFYFREGANSAMSIALSMMAPPAICQTPSRSPASHPVSAANTGSIAKITATRTAGRCFCTVV